MEKNIKRKEPKLVPFFKTAQLMDDYLLLQNNFNFYSEFPQYINKFFTDFMSAFTGTTGQECNDKSNIRLEIDENLEEEEYKLYIYSQGMTLYANHFKGFYYALTNIYQLSFFGQYDENNNISLNNYVIQDKPYYSNRCLFIDLERLSEDKINTFFLFMSINRLNTLVVNSDYVVSNKIKKLADKFLINITTEDKLGTCYFAEVHDKKLAKKYFKQLLNNEVSISKKHIKIDYDSVIIDLRNFNINLDSDAEFFKVCLYANELTWTASFNLEYSSFYFRCKRLFNQMFLNNDFNLEKLYNCFNEMDYKNELFKEKEVIIDEKVD